jgi:hypothetical protein
MQVTIGFLVEGARYSAPIPDSLASTRELTGYYDYQGSVHSISYRTVEPDGGPIGAGLVARDSIDAKAGTVIVFQQPESPTFVVGYVSAGVGYLVTYMDDEASLKDVFDHVSVEEAGSFGAHVTLTDPLRAGDIRVLTERDEVMFSGAGDASVSSVRFVAEPARRKPQPDAIKTGNGGLAQASSPLGVRVFCDGSADLGALQSAAETIAEAIAPA